MNDNPAILYYEPFVGSKIVRLLSVGWHKRGIASALSTRFRAKSPVRARSAPDKQGDTRTLGTCAFNYTELYPLMIHLLALILVLLTGLYLVSLAGILLFSPAQGRSFLGGFAGSALTHYLEIGLRFIAGGAILLYAPQMLFSGFFLVFGWILVLTTIGLLAIPWRWHQRFAKLTVPYATRRLWLVAVASFIFGGFIIACVLLGST